MKLNYRSLLFSGASVLALSACAESSGPEASFPAGNLQLSVAPLTLPGIDEACYSIKVANDAAGTSVVFSETDICSTKYGDGKGAITFVGTCDATADADPVAAGIQNRVELQLTKLSGNVGSPGDLVAGDDYVNPCATANDCVLYPTCVENGDTPVTFNLTIMRDADQGFFDIAVNFSDVFCSAKVDCQPALLFNDAGVRGKTAVVAFACTAGDTGPTNMYLNDITLASGGSSGSSSGSGSSSSNSVTTTTVSQAGAGVTVGTFAVDASSLGSKSSLEAGGSTYSYNFVAVSFTATQAGTYTFGQTEAPTDTVMILYNGDFISAKPENNVLEFNDDSNNHGTVGATGVGCGGSLGLCPQISSSLSAGQKVTLVISTFSSSSSTSLGFPLSFYSTLPGTFSGGTTSGGASAVTVTYDVDASKGNNDAKPGDNNGGKYAIYKDQEELPGYTKYFWNVAIDITGVTGTLTTKGTASGVALADKKTPAATKYPVINFSVNIADGACTPQPLDGPGSGVTTSYTTFSAQETFTSEFVLAP